MTRSNPETCQPTCSEHSGIKVMQYTILAGVVMTLFMQGYNTFVQNSEIKTQIARIEQKLASLDEKDKYIELAINDLKQRVTRLEQK